MYSHPPTQPARPSSDQNLLLQEEGDFAAWQVEAGFPGFPSFPSPNSAQLWEAAPNVPSSLLVAQHTLCSAEDLPCQPHCPSSTVIAARKAEGSPTQSDPRRSSRGLTKAYY